MHGSIRGRITAQISASRVDRQPHRDWQFVRKIRRGPNSACEGFEVVAYVGAVPRSRDCRHASCGDQDGRMGVKEGREEREEQASAGTSRAVGLQTSPTPQAGLQ